MVIIEWDFIVGQRLTSYTTAQFKLYTHMQAHACARMLNVCKTSKTGACMFCFTEFWCAHMGQ